MKRRTIAFLSLALALLLALAPVSTGALYLKGDNFATYTVREGGKQDFGDGLVYNKYIFDDELGKEQVCFTFEFNPKESDYRSYVYHTSASEGYKITDDAANAWKEGIDVVAAVNGDTFSMAADTYGTPSGLYIREGKLMAAKVQDWRDYYIVFAEDGSADVVLSLLSYDLKINDTACDGLYLLNKKTGNFDSSKIYYFDDDMSSQSPVSSAAPCKELLCDITGGKLAVGQTLTGTVVQVNDAGTSTIGENQFMLAIGNNNGTAYEVGNAVSLAVEETSDDEGAKELMSAAYHAIHVFHVLVHDGVDYVEHNWTENVTALAQRCVLGIKPDGGLVYFVCDGRRMTAGGPNGLTFRQVIEIMKSYGCEEIMNLDGGGSTAVVVTEGDGKFDWEFVGEGDGRRVGNSLMIVRRPGAPARPAKTNEPIVDKPGTELRNVALNKPYRATKNGIMAPTYLSSLYGDKYSVKMTDGRYRVSGEDPERYSSVFLGSNFNVTYNIDLETVRDDLRSVVVKNVKRGDGCDFKDGNVIVYISDDGETWPLSAEYDMTTAPGGIEGTADYTFAFKGAQHGRYVKLVIGSPAGRLSFDEIEVYGMVDASEPKEEIKPEDPALLPAEEPTEANENVAVGCPYTFTCNGSEILPYDSTEEPRYYNKQLADRKGDKLTNGKIGTAGTSFDGATVGVRAGAGSLMEVTIDLGKVVDDIEFVQVQNIINNAASFGDAEAGAVSRSLDGAGYTPVDVRDAYSAGNNQYRCMTLQANEPFSARYVKVSFKTLKFLIGLGEVTVCKAAPKAQLLLGDVNDDGEVDNVDASLVLQYDASLIDEAGLVLKAGDVNADGAVDNLDAAMILQYDAGIIEGFGE